MPDQPDGGARPTRPDRSSCATSTASSGWPVTPIAGSVDGDRRAAGRGATGCCSSPTTPTRRSPTARRHWRRSASRRVGDVLTSAQAAALLLHPGERALVAGGPGIVEALDRPAGVDVAATTARSTPSSSASIASSTTTAGSRVGQGARRGAARSGRTTTPPIPRPTGRSRAAARSWRPSPPPAAWNPSSPASPTRRWPSLVRRAGRRRAPPPRP